ncbi:MAG: ATP synthase F1 subunit gamma [Candidatus Binataceae bacterium]
MASLKAIRRRIASVKSTQQITRAMKLVAAARLRRAQEALIAARPYSQALARVADSLLRAEGIDVAPAENAKKTALVAVIASDRGLCGGYNTNIIRAGEQTRRNLESEGSSVQYYVVGKKAVDHYKRTRAPIAVESINNLPRLATLELARAIAARMLADFQSGAISEASIVYTRFQSAMTQIPTYERLLPVPAQERKPGEELAPATDYLIEPSAKELVPVVVRSYLEASVFHALLESEASEYGAKMTAMDSATNNAIEMIDSLTLEMNRARQAQVTRELMDIVGGAEALRG